MTIAITRREPGAGDLRREAARCRDARAARRMLALALVLEGSSREEAARAAAVERGPDPDRDGVVRWRRVDLQALIEARFAVRLHERSVGKVLRRLGFSRVSVRPRHPKADEAAQEAFKKASPSWWRERCPSTPAASRSRSGSRCYEGGHHRQ